MDKCNFLLRLLRNRGVLAVRQAAALEAEAYSAWHYATRYETFWIPLTNSSEEPKHAVSLGNRTFWVKAFQRDDSKLLGRSAKYGNEAYSVRTILGFNDTLSKAMFEYALLNGAPTNVAYASEWHSLSMECRVEKLDSSEWTASECHFSPVASKPDFPFELVKGQN